MANIQDPIWTLSIKAAADLDAYTFVGAAGDVCAAGEKAFGVCPVDAARDDSVNVNLLGVVLVLSGAAVSAGVKVKSDASGKAIALGGSGASSGIALDEADEADQLIRIALGV